MKNPSFKSPRLLWGVAELSEDGTLRLVESQNIYCNQRRTPASQQEMPILKKIMIPAWKPRRKSGHLGKGSFQSSGRPHSPTAARGSPITVGAILGSYLRSWRARLEHIASCTNIARRADEYTTVHVGGT